MCMPFIVSLSIHLYLKSSSHWWTKPYCGGIILGPLPLQGQSRGLPWEKAKTGHVSLAWLHDPFPPDNPVTVVPLLLPRSCKVPHHDAHSVLQWPVIVFGQQCHSPSAYTKCTSLHTIALDCIFLKLGAMHWRYCAAQFLIEMFFTALYCTLLHFILLHCSSIHYSGKITELPFSS